MQDDAVGERPADLVGRVVAERYRVDALVGEGSMGLVYRATHLLMGKTVALKVLHPELLENAEAVERFQREAQAGANLEHVHICSTADFGGFGEGRFYLIMEFLDGLPLDQVIAREPIEARRAVRIVLQVAQALGRAHEMEIIHRDVKPENIVLLEGEGGEDHAKLTDFGVARVRLGDATKLTQAGTTYGTPLYMSPEQARGQRIDHRTDLYSLGIVLFELLTGGVPFFGERVPVILAMQCHEAPPRMGEVCPERAIPKVLEAIVSRLLRKDPEERYQSAAELEFGLHDALLVMGEGGGDGERIVAPPEPVFLEVPRGQAPERGTAREGGGLSPFGEEETLRPELGRASYAGFGLDAEPTDEGRPAVAMSTFVAELSRARPAFRRVFAGLRARPWLAAMVCFFVFASLLAPSAFWAVLEEHEEGEVRRDLPSTLGGERRERLTQGDVRPAVEALAAGKPREAVALLEPVAAATTDPHVSFLLGRAQALAGEPEVAVASFQSVLSREPRYARDEELLTAVLPMLTSEEPSTAAAAAPLAAGPLQQALGPRLAHLAEHDESRPVRRRAYGLLRESGALAGLERWQQIAVELRHTSECEGIRRLVVEARDEGDPRALPALERNARLPKTGCGFFEKSDCYECMRGELSAAIRGLRKTGAP